MKVLTLTSQRFALIDVEKKKLLKSAGYGVLAIIAYALIAYLEQFGLPEELKVLAPMLPFVINFLTKWAGEHTYVVKK